MKGFIETKIKTMKIECCKLGTLEDEFKTKNVVQKKCVAFRSISMCYEVG